MTRRLLPLLLALHPAFTQAQFGPQHFAFVSDLSYPYGLMTGDLDGDGDLDAAAYEQTEWVWFANDGLGHFGPKQHMLTASLPGTVPRKLVDLDGDGDADLVLNANSYLNDGTGEMTYYESIPSGGALSMLFEDLDGDGDPDDVVRTSNSVTLLLNNGHGHFSPNVAIGPAGATTSLGVGRFDVDGDGDADLVLGGANPQAGWYPNLGGGNYGVQHPIAGWGTAMPMTGDADGDGDPDLLAFGVAPGVYWYATDGVGGLTLMDTLSTWTGVPAFLADLDGDQDVDWPVGTGTSCNVQVMANQSGASTTTVAVENFSGYNLVGTSYAAGDMDGDGRTDLVACHGLGIAMWYGNQGDGTISARHELSRTLCGAYDVAATDLDLDGDLDLVSASYYGDIVATYENTGNGTFGPQHVLAEHLDKVSALYTGDLDNDGDPDILTNNATAAVLRNDGGGNWTAGTLPDGTVPRLLLDVDEDHDLDVIGTGLWLANDGSGAFTTVASAVLAAAGKVVDGDINGDGHVDLVVGGDPFHALMNDGAGNFTDVTSPGIGLAYGDLALADLDNDGDLDIATIQYGPDQQWFRNDGSGAFTAETELTGVPNGGRAILARDINGDGSTDLIWARSEGYTHRTYLNLNNGDGTFGPLVIVDPSAESTAKLILADVNGDAVEDLVEARFNTLAWQENHFYDRYRIRGDVFKDYDQDGVRDPTDGPLAFLPMRTSPATDVLTWTNSYGGFDQPVDSGATYRLWPQLIPAFTVTTTPDTAIVQANANEPIVDSLVFGVGPDGPANNVVFTAVNGVFRCDSERDIHLTLRNLGSFIPTGLVVDLALTGDLDILHSEPAPDSIANGHVYWSLDELFWFDVVRFHVIVRTGPAGQAGFFDAHVTAGNTPDTWSASGGAVFSCAYDPNDKQVDPKGYGAAGAVPIDQDWLRYTIRFQNTGTDTALNVVLVDPLSDDLDWNSMEVLAASHPLTRIRIEEDGELQFRFDRIMLPHQAADDAGSNGFVTFRIRPRAGRPSGTEIPNHAEIYFDFNTPVLTDPVLNTLIDCSLYTVAITSDDGTVLHASAGELFQWFLDGDSIVGADGPDLVVEGHGDYTVQATSVHGCTATSDPFQVISTGIDMEAGLVVAAVPNPATDAVRILASNVLTAGDRIELVDLNGRVLRTLRGNGSRGITLERAGTAAGLYVVRVARAEGPVRVVRLVWD